MGHSEKSQRKTRRRPGAAVGAVGLGCVAGIGVGLGLLILRIEAEHFDERLVPV